MKRKQEGFTLIEIIFTVGIFAILLTVSMAAFGSFRDDSQLQNTTNDIQAVLRLAQNKTVASEGAEQYGVYFNVSSSPHEYILFGGASYASGTVETIYQLSDLVQFSSASSSFSGLSGQEVVFDRIQGTTANYGEVVLQSTLDAGNIRTISVSGGGDVGINAGPAPTNDDCISGMAGDRMCDSRHVHIDYTRNPAIDIVNEEIILDFVGTGVQEIIPIASNLSGGQIVWEGTITVDSEPQTIKVHTHKLNDGFDSQFSVHRDRRFNTKVLTIELSGDSSFTLIKYDADGTVTRGTALGAQEPDEQ